MNPAAFPLWIYIRGSETGFCRNTLHSFESTHIKFRITRGTWGSPVFSTVGVGETNKFPKGAFP